jgi:catechol 2,3-dioxygenase-like lactoylglutathione lyase family enzyme
VEVPKVIAAPDGLGAVTLFVEDLPRTAAFYRDVFGLESVHEDDDATAFRFGATILNLLRTSAAHELVEPVAVAGPGAGVRFQLTVWVDDVDAVCADLKKRGVALLNGPMDREWGQRTAAFADPSGHVWEVAQDLSRG